MNHLVSGPRLAVLAAASFFAALAADIHAAPRYESGLLTNDQPAANTWHAVSFAKAFSSAPVVVLGPASNGDAQPVTLRVRNVTASGFEYQLDEWSYQDGIHGQENVSYLALEPGTHTIGGLTWQAARVSSVTKTAQTVSYSSSFGSTPVVIAQLESAANSQTLTTRVRSVTTTGFELRLQSQESDTGTASGESVGYVAITPGAGTLDGAPFLVGRTGSSITQAWSTLTFGATYRQPVFLAQTQTQAGADPFTIRRRNLSHTSVEIYLQEEDSADAEATHSAEDVGYLVLGETQGELRAKLGVGSLPVNQSAPTVWATAAFDQPYTNPVVVFGPLREGELEPAHIRVRNVTTTGFEYQIEEWDYLDGARPPESVSYLVAESGNYVIGGKRWQFARVPSVTNTAAAQTFAETFVAAPVVLTQVATRNGAAAVNGRVSAVTTSGFTLQLQEEEAADGTHVAEEVHYAAIEKGNGRLFADELIFEAGSATAVNHVFSKVNLTRKLAAPSLFAGAQTKNDAEAIVTRFRDLGATSFESRVQDEQSANSESTHANETAGYLVFASQVDLDEDGIGDAWELANGLNPNNAADASLDPDGDGVSNLLEFLSGTGPSTANSGGTVTVQPLVPDAYEKEDTAARFRISRTGGTVPVTVYYTLSGRATGADYQVKGANGAVLTGSVTIPANESSVDVLIDPSTDTLNEYPENVQLTVSTNSRYTVGAQSVASVLVNDAAPTAENEQLFVAFLSPANGVQSYASGFATVYLNGPKSAARVNLNFSGLTSNQTNAYLRYGIPSGVGPELRPTLPIGQVVNEPYTIIPVGALSGQDIVDALFQVNGHYNYVNVGTGSFPAGEISGILARQTGSSTFTPPPAPPAITALSGDALTRDVTRFLTQATFGPTKAEIDALVNEVNTTHAGNRINAFQTWINNQFALEQTRLLDLTFAADADEWDRRGATPSNFTNNDEPRHNNRRRSWWALAAASKDQLRQRLAFALSEIFVVSDNETEVRKRHYGTANYYDLLSAGTSGNYRQLIEDISKSPIMGKYLSHLKNQKAIVDSQTGQILVSPDENYAREILQLFSIGLVQRHLDGSLKLGSDGLPIATYSNSDITELARVFTGWSFSKKNGAASNGYPEQDNTNFFQGNGPAYFQASWTNPLKNFAAYHDTGAKTLLGSAIAAGLNGQQDLDAALDVIFNHPNVAPFISRLLIQRLVTSNPSAGYLYRVSQKFENNGSGVRGDLKAVVRAILLDYEARSLDVISNVGYGKQKEPIVRYLQLLRAVGGKSDIPISSLSAFGYPASQLDNFPAGASLYRYPDTDGRLSQTPQSAPTVFNWFLPDHNPGGAVAAAGLVGPEFQITTETTTIQAINYHYNLTNNDNGQSTTDLIGEADTLLDNVKLDRAPLIALYDQEITAGKTALQATTTVLDHLDVLLTAGNLKVKYASASAPNPRSIILNSVSSLAATTTTASRVKELLYGIITSPEYIHQK